MHLFDTESLARALDLPLDAKLRHILRDHVRHLATLDPAVADTTYFLVIEPGISAADVADELGWSPLVDPDGNSFGSDHYQPFHSYAADEGGWLTMYYNLSNEAVAILLIKDDVHMDPRLHALFAASCENPA